MERPRSWRSRRSGRRRKPKTEGGGGRREEGGGRSEFGLGALRAPFFFAVPVPPPPSLLPPPYLSDMPTLRRDTELFTVEDRLPVLPLRDVVVFPHVSMPLLVGRPASLAAVEA